MECLHKVLTEATGAAGIDNNGGERDSQKVARSTIRGRGGICLAGTIRVAFSELGAYFLDHDIE